MDTTRRALRRKPLTDCSNVVPRKSEKHGSADVKVSVKVHDMRRKLKMKSIETKENVAEKERSVDVIELELEKSLLLSTPPVRKLKPMTASYSVSPMTVYSRRNASQSSYGSSSCPPPGKKRVEYSDEDDQSSSLWHSEPSKKKRSLQKDLISQDFIERQRAYFQEIDKFELPEEEVSESE